MRVGIKTISLIGAYCLIASSFSSAQVTTDATATDVLKSYADSSTASNYGRILCHAQLVSTRYDGVYQRAVDSHFSKVEAALARSAYVEARTQAGNGAAGFAWCFINDQSSSRLGEASYVVGQLLAAKYDADKLLGTGESQLTIAARRDALMLLSFAGNAGFNTAGIVKRILPTPGKPSETDAVSEQDIIQSSATDIAAARHASRPRFKRDFTGRTLEVKGRVLSVFEDQSGGFVVELVGEFNRPGGYVSGDITTCHISRGGASIDRAIDLNTGQIGTVRGTFREFGYGETIALKDCIIP